MTDVAPAAQPPGSADPTATAALGPAGAGLGRSAVVAHTDAGGSTRLDVALVRQGLARSRQRAAELIAAGQVRVGGAPARKPAQVVGVLDEISVAAGEEWVSRAAHKLLGALDALDSLGTGSPDPAGAVCLDAGASTGGFTHVLLERGAERVLAVDVGHGQLDPALDADPRVWLREGLNIRELRPADLPEVPRVVVADLSFISLTLVLGPLLAVCAPGGDLLLLVKPQFEVGRRRLGAGGVVTSAALRREAVLGVARAAVAHGASVRAVVPSLVAGEHGNREYFLWLTAPGDGAATEGAVPDDLEAAVRAAVDRDVPALVGGGV